MTDEPFLFSSDIASFDAAVALLTKPLTAKRLCLLVLVEFVTWPSSVYHPKYGCRSCFYHPQGVEHDLEEIDFPEIYEGFANG
jgi:hypothetical protein